MRKGGSRGGAGGRREGPVVKVNADMTIADGRYMTATFGC
jgi:hypothetical protein